MQDEGAGDQLHLPRRHRRLPPRPHLRMRRQLLRPGRFTFAPQALSSAEFSVEDQSITGTML